jgi:hypothetical protein
MLPKIIGLYLESKLFFPVNPRSLLFSIIVFAITSTSNLKKCWRNRITCVFSWTMNLDRAKIKLTLWPLAHRNLFLDINPWSEYLHLGNDTSICEFIYWRFWTSKHAILCHLANLFSFFPILVSLRAATTISLPDISLHFDESVGRVGWKQLYWSLIVLK